MTAADPAYPLIGPRRDPGDYRGALTLALNRRGDVLLQLRDDIEGIIAPGYWGFFGGGVEPGEDLQEAAAREFEEEAGLTLAPPMFEPFATVVSSLPPHGLLYIHRLQTPVEARDLRLGEGAGFAFCSRRQWEQLDLIPYLRPVLEFLFD